jgi:cell division protein FtsB
MDIRSSIVKYLCITLTLAIAIFTVIVSVQTIEDIVTTSRRHAEVETRVAELQDKITRDSTFIEDLQHSPDFVEKFARENFLLQRKGEEVYIIEE